MKIFKCKIMGDVSNTQCYDCFTNSMGNQSLPSRVVCKSSNVTEEVAVEIETEQTSLVMEKVS